MTKTIAFCILIVTIGVLLSCVVCEPSFLSDSNRFLKGFVNGELLNVLGVILAITLASSANLHLEFNKIEERYKKVALVKSRSEVKSGTYSLILVFGLAVLIVVLKPIVDNGERSEAVFNGLSLLTLEWYIIVMADILETALAIPANLSKGD
ncbi:MAG: hypothetical protein ACYC5H_11540 [Methylovirgula sp.]